MLSNFTYVIHNDKIKTTHILVDLLDCSPPSPAKEITYDHVSFLILADHIYGYCL